VGVHLTVYRNQQVLQQVPLAGQSLSIGQRRDNDIVLQGQGIGDLHVKLQFIAGQYYVINCDRTVGITLNGRAVNQAALNPGDRCQVGEFELVVESAPAQVATDADADLLALLRVMSFFSPEDRKALLERMMDCLIQIFRAQRCSVLLPDAAGAFRAAVTRNIEPGALERAISRTAIQQVLERRAPVCHGNVLASDLGGAKSITAGSVQSLVCYPLLKGDSVVAILYLDSTSNDSAFLRGDFSLLEAFGSHALAALENFEEKEGLRLHAGQMRQMAQDAIREIHASDHVVVQDQRSQEIWKQVQKVAGSEVDTLILGPSGTGKELIARAIHHGSKRKSGPFIAVNCAALPHDLVESELFGHEKGAFSGAHAAKPGKFELAHRGTLFLDEVGELPVEIQSKLLRALQERTIDRVGGTKPYLADIRVIAATNGDLAEKIKLHQFREDLYYRINVFTIRLPPLKERLGDIEPLVSFFIDVFNRRCGRNITGVTARARRALLSYPWPGNVRELRNVIERAFVLEEGDAIDLESLPFGNDLPAAAPAALPPETSLSDAVAAVERSYIEAALLKHGYNVMATARSLKIARATLYKKMEDLGIRPVPEPEA
jgi:transcriptional regulator with GAF, ATPase, and Fis domain